MYDHIVVVIEENKSFNTVIGNYREAPYMNYLADRGLLFTNSYFASRPSQPNYIALFSGKLYGIQNNRINPKINAPNLYTELNKLGKTFICYSEDLPFVGFDGKEHNSYVRKHNPSCQFTNVPPEVNQPFSSFPSQGKLANDFRNLPTVSFVIPNQDHNAHDGSLQEADQWLYQNISKYAEWAPNNNSLLIVTFDEPETNLYDWTPIPTIFNGAGIKPGIYSGYIDHNSLLQFILDMYGAKL